MKCICRVRGILSHSRPLGSWHLPGTHWKTSGMHFINWIVPAFLCCPQSSGLGRREGKLDLLPVSHNYVGNLSCLSCPSHSHAPTQMTRKEGGLGEQWALQSGHFICHPDSPWGLLEVKKISGSFAGPHFSASKAEIRPSAEEKKTMISGIFMVLSWRSPEDFKRIPLVIQSSQLPDSGGLLFQQREKQEHRMADYSKSPLAKEVWNPEVMDPNLVHH